MGYYDTVLAGIATSLTAGMIVGGWTPVSFHLATAAGVLTASAFMYHGLFHRIPTTHTT